MPQIQAIRAQEILDSRGTPTVFAELLLDNGIRTQAMVPSGASTGENEALELRDGGTRYLGKGVLKAVAHVQEIIQPALKGLDPLEQALIDETMCRLDGTPTKSRLGANAILAVSMAAARAGAAVSGLPLYRYLGGAGAATLPMPMLNVINGGAHAGNNLDIQEFMIMPVGGQTFAEALRIASEVFHTLKKVLASKSWAPAWATKAVSPRTCPPMRPPWTSLWRPWSRRAIVRGRTWYWPWTPPPRSFSIRPPGNTSSKRGRLPANAAAMTEYYRGLADRYPIVSIEDGLAEDDWDGWVHLTQALGGRMQLVGDDLFVTNVQYLQRGIDLGAANAILIKLNQIGTVTETLDTIGLARRHGYRSSFPIAPGRPRTPLLPTWPWPPASVKLRPVLFPVRTHRQV